MEPPHGGDYFRGDVGRRCDWSFHGAPLTLAIPLAGLWRYRELHCSGAASEEGVSVRFDVGRGCSCPTGVAGRSGAAASAFVLGGARGPGPVAGYYQVLAAAALEVCPLASRPGQHVRSLRRLLRGSLLHRFQLLRRCLVRMLVPGLLLCASLRVGCFSQNLALAS